MLCEDVCCIPITYRCRELRSSCLTLSDLRKRLSLMVPAIANDSMQGFSCWLPRLKMVGIASNGQEDLSLCCTAVFRLESWCWWRSVLLSPVCSLQSSRFACRPRMLLHDCRQQLRQTSVRSSTSALARSPPLYVVGWGFVVLSDIKISCSRFWTKWRWVGEEASLARAALPSDELPGSFSHFGHSSR